MFCILTVRYTVEIVIGCFFFFAMPAGCKCIEGVIIIFVFFRCYFNGEYLNKVPGLYFELKKVKLRYTRKKNIKLFLRECFIENNISLIK